MFSCPRCGVGLFFGQTKNVSMHACGRCGGVWLDQGSSRTVREVLPDDALQLARSASAHGQSIDTRGEVACPACGKATRRSKTSEQGIEIDECDQHGVWFDRGELNLIAEALKQKRPAPAAPPAAVPGFPPPSGASTAGFGVGARAPQAPPPGYVGAAGKVALAAGAVGVVGAAAMMASQHQQQQAQAQASSVAEDVLEAGVDVVDTALDLADSGVVDLAADGASAAAGAAGEALSALADSGAAEAVAEGAGSLIGGIFSLLGSLFD